MSPHTTQMILTLVTALLTSACHQEKLPRQNAQDADGLLIVDCLLPGQVRKLGLRASFLTARRPIKTSASECAIRGGEYTAFDRADLGSALKIWLSQAQAGDPTAQNYVGEIYEKGFGAPADYATAAFWFEKAAQQNFPNAQINLGHLYEQGLGVKKNRAKALNLYRKASGLSSDQLQFTTSIQATAQAHQTEIAALQQKLAVETSKSSIIKVLRQELATLQKTLQKTQIDATENQALQRQIQSLKQALEKKSVKKTDLDHVKSKIQQIWSDFGRSNQQLANAPRIEIIDPPMTLTRSGDTALLQPDTQSQQLIGKVIAPLGLKNFMINGKLHTLDEYQLFWVDVPIVQERTPINIVAVDQQDQKATIQFSLFSKRATQSIPNPGARAATTVGASIEFGQYHALVIGNNTYANYPNLQTAVLGATETARLLREKYGFNTTLLLNANRYDVLFALNSLHDLLTEDDNLLIYYAGHGDLSTTPTDMQGFWLPVDAKPQEKSTWVSNRAISDLLHTLPAKHVLVVADSCYSGTLSRATVARANLSSMPLQEQWMRIMTQTRARTVLTSGGIEPVLDSSGGPHSLFTNAFLSVLRENRNVLEGFGLYRRVLDKMRKQPAALNQFQTPEYASIQHAGHEAGEFFLKPQGAPVTDTHE